MLIIFQRVQKKKTQTVTDFQRVAFRKLRKLYQHYTIPMKFSYRYGHIHIWDKYIYAYLRFNESKEGQALSSCLLEI